MMRVQTIAGGPAHKRRLVARSSLVVVAAAVLSSGCESAIYGEGSLYLWNGTDDRVEFSVKGRSTGEAALRFEQGQLFEEMIAGEYVITPIKEGVPLMPIKATITKNRLTVINFQGAGCFARADVSGMYVRGKKPVRVLETFEGREVMELQNEIAVMPGRRLPSSAPRITPEHVYQRLVVIPCRLLKPSQGAEPESALAEFVRGLR